MTLLQVINYLLVPLNLIDIKLSFELYLCLMTGQSIVVIFASSLL